MSYIDLEFEPIETELYTSTGDVCPNHKALVHPDGHVLGVVGRSYRVISNEELFDNMYQAIESSMSDKAIATMEVIDSQVRNYAKTYREIRFPEISRSIETRTHKTDVGFRIIEENSFDGSGSVRVLLGSIDYHCTNGMIHGQYDVFKKTHKGHAPIPSFEGIFVKALEQYTDKMDLYQKWASKSLTDSTVHNFVANLLPATKKNMAKINDPIRYHQRPKQVIPTEPYSLMGDNLIRQYENETFVRGNNVWAMYSAMTFYASHDSEIFPLNKMSKDQDNDQERLSRRSDKVTSWLNSDAWSELIAA